MTPRQRSVIFFLAFLVVAVIGSARAGERPRLVAQIGHGGARIMGAELGRDGAWLLTWGQDKAAILWDVETRREIRRFTAAELGADLRAAFSPDGSRVLYHARGLPVRLFDPETGKEDTRFASGETEKDAAFSPDGKHILTVSGGGRARLWNLQTGEPTRDFEIHCQGNSEEWIEDVRCVAFSPDGRDVALGTESAQARLVIFDVATGAEKTRVAEEAFDPPGTVRYSPDGSRILVTYNFRLTLYDAATGERVLSVPWDFRRTAGFSPDGRWLAASCESWLPESPSEAEAVIWDVRTGAEVRRITPCGGDASHPHSPAVLAVAFSADGERFLTAGYHEPLRLWAISSEVELRNWGGAEGVWSHVAFVPGEREVLLCGSTGSYLFSPESGTTVGFTSLAMPVNAASLSSNGETLFTATRFPGPQPGALFWSSDSTPPRPVPGSPTEGRFLREAPRILLMDAAEGLRLFDLETRTEVRRYGPHPAGILSFACSADGRCLVTGGPDAARVWDGRTGEQTAVARGRAQKTAISPDGRTFLVWGLGTPARLVDSKSGKTLRTFETRIVVDFGELPEGVEPPEPPEGGWGMERTYSAALSPSGERIITASDRALRMWDSATGELLWCVRQLSMPLQVSFSPGGDEFAVGYARGEVEVRATSDGAMGRRLLGHLGMISSLEFSRDGRLLVSSSDEGTTRIWDWRRGSELVQLLAFRDGGWAVLDPEGRYDASNGGDVAGLHWVVGTEPISLDQLKERYYDPGLLGKVLGVNPEPRREVGAFTAPELYPEVELDPPTAESAKLGIRLTNRGGGLGRVVVKVNGKELTADARGPGLDPDAEAAAISVDLSGDPRLVPGEENRIEVLAYNAEGYLRSRGLGVEYTPPGRAKSAPPELWAVVVGVSDYQGDAIDLRFAAKDAEDFATALRVGGNRLFGEEHVRLSVLTTAGEARPTRKAIVTALEAVSAAKPGDVLVVYLSGHGVNLGGQDGEFHYLTAEARSADLSDPAVRAQVSLSSAELTELIKELPPLKQVLVLDTCASGRLVEKLTEKREVPGSQVRALERMKDRTGLFVLAGCASDRVSYEATRFAQGLLTHSLLMGMKGAALRADEYVDVSTLFGFSADQVPELARDIGGVQRPLIASPKGASFDIGRLTEEDKAKVPLTAVRPMILRSKLQHAEEFEDVLGLEKRVDRLLADASAKGADADLVFVDAREFPDAYRIAGQYVTEGGVVTVRFRLFRGEEKSETLKVEGPADDPEALAGAIVAAARKEIE